MKGRRPYRVPLSAEAAKLLKAIGPKPEGFIFERAPGKPFSNNALLVLRNRMGFKERCTTHGFRSSFREWAQSNNVDRTVAEMCLDHKVFSKTEAAYMRADLLEERRAVLGDWATYVTVPTIAKTVVEFKRGQK
jgi:integrase